MQPQPLGVIAGTDVVIYTDETVTEFYVHKNNNLVPVQLEQLKVAYSTRGINWLDPTVGQHMDALLTNRSSSAPTGYPVSSAPDNSYSPDPAPSAGPELAPDGAEISHVFDSDDNFFLGIFSHRGRRMEFGFQNSTRCFFYYDGNRMAELTDDAARSMAKSKRMVTWDSESIRAQVFDILDLRYRGPKNSADGSPASEPLDSSRLMGFGVVALGVVLLITALQTAALYFLGKPKPSPLALGLLALPTFISLALLVALLLSLWKVYEKAGEAGWKSLVPIYQYFVLMKIVGRPWWWMLLLCVPVVSMVVLVVVMNDLSKSFGHGTGFTVGLLLVPFVFIPMLAFGPSPYLGPSVASA